QGLRPLILGSLAAAVAVPAFGLLSVEDASAYSTCEWREQSTRYILMNDCETDETLYVPHGYTVDGRGKTLTFLGEGEGDGDDTAIASDGGEMSIKNINIVLEDCSTGIYFNDAG